MEFLNKKILIVEDEQKIARFLQMELEHERYQTAIETNGRRALERIARESFDLILLDVMLPELDGYAICSKVRETSQIPIIMVTAKESVADRVHGLDIGADDYITKPFAVQELLARIRVIFRKQAALSQPPCPRELRIKNLVLYPERFEAWVGEKPVELTKKEYELLTYLVLNKHIVLSRERILHEIWGYDYIGDTNIVDVFIHYLRDKLDDSLGENFIHTVRGVGYVVKD